MRAISLELPRLPLGGTCLTDGASNALVEARVIVASFFNFSEGFATDAQGEPRPDRVALAGAAPDDVEPAVGVGGPGHAGQQADLAGGQQQQHALELLGGFARRPLALPAPRVRPSPVPSRPAPRSVRFAFH